MPDPLADICPDCGHPISTHAMYRTGLCPVVRFPSYPSVWDEVSDPLARLTAAAAARANADLEYRLALAAAHEAGHSYAELGRLVGISRQNIRKMLLRRM